MRKPSTILVTGILLAIFFSVSLFLRAYLPHNQIFVNDWVKFSSNDAYFYMRIVDNLAINFPHLSHFDPFISYPQASGVGGVVFFAWLIAGSAWLFGLGAPSPHLIDVVGAYTPAVMAALMVIPVYFIGKNLFSRGAGLLAAALIAILPGEFLGRSILGFTDHHIAETLFTTIAMLFLILALKAGRGAGVTYRHLLKRDWTTSQRTLIYSLLSGLSLGVYLATWIGGLLFAFIIMVYFILQFVLDHLKGKSTDYLGIIGVIVFAVAIIVVLPFNPETMTREAMFIALAALIVLGGVSWFVAARKMKPILYLAALVAAGGVGLAALSLFNKGMLNTMLSQFSLFMPSGPSTTTLEMQHLSIPLAWGNFNTSFFFAIAAWLILVYLALKHSNSERTLFLVWALIAFAAALAQRRFAYYFVVNVAVLTGYLAWQFVWLAGLRTLVRERAQHLAALTAKPEAGKSSRQAQRQAARPKRKASPGITVNHINFSLAAIAVFFFVFFPNFTPAVVTASDARFAPSDAWYSSLVWLKDNSPAPFGNPDFYYQRYEAPKEGEYKWPDSAYGVSAWWDYGYWITRIAQRLPTANPSQDSRQIINTTHLFLSQNETQAREAGQVMGTRYIIIDSDTVTSKFWAVVTWSGQPLTDYFEEYYFPPQKAYVRLYYPEYYRSLTTRLYNFDARAVTPKSTIVVAWDAKQNRDGQTYKEITNAQSFNDYQTAAAFIQAQKTGNYRIVGSNPFVSPVPLEALKDYRLVYASAMTQGQAEVGQVPAVKIFEYTGSRASPVQK